MVEKWASADALRAHAGERPAAQAPSWRASSPGRPTVRRAAGGGGADLTRPAVTCRVAIVRAAARCIGAATVAAMAAADGGARGAVLDRCATTGACVRAGSRAEIDRVVESAGDASPSRADVRDRSAGRRGELAQSAWGGLDAAVAVAG